jgi:curli biogenesis system outer membrane secretion channel CsgG
LTGAEVVVTGAVTEFGRKETGTVGLGGIIQKGKTQSAYSKVQLSVVDAVTSQVLISVQGAGEYALSNEEVLGFGSRAGYDATLNDKVLNLAMIEAVNRLVEGLEKGQWHPAE